MMRGHMRSRRGFVLVAALWIVGALALAGVRGRWTARDAVRAARNRVSLTRAAWLADGCVATVRASVDAALRDSAASFRNWTALDSVVSSTVGPLPCAAHLAPAGLAVDVNSASVQQLQRLFAESGEPAATADSLAAAIADWRDADSVAAEWGAEAAWYRGRGLPSPRNAPFAAAAELELVRGMHSAFSRNPALRTLLSADGDAVWVERAPIEILELLPGVSAEAAARVAAERSRASRVDWQSIADALSPTDRALLLSNFPRLAAATTDRPVAWLLRVDAVGGDSTAETVNVRFANAGRRAAVVRYTRWP